ncbi:hypothetical protein H072_2964 [Dactylellina haptotyla CBS 200.50]|uniref:Methyltransferase domain-containing protein n=1 Tax=Dactylellina haptotyla (strain CBS 200.50) TaxID=1284197 RepID=S8BU93_DACHA|nr:hypothetical protein H072_2964 [Dactylellina haptotyla CBS 200.50]
MNYVIGPRLHLFEIDDQTWFPQYLREKIQVCLTFCWTVSFPGFNIPRVSGSPGPSASSSLAKVLRKELGTSLSSYTFIDFCAGAGGPTPVVEKHLNRQLVKEGLEPVNFVLTDLYPNPEAWKKIQAQSEAFRWIAQPVDAGNAPKKEILLGDDGAKGKKVFRMFNLAFHHFDDEGAKRILKDAVNGSDAIGIFEIQSRTLSGFLSVAAIGPLLTFLSPFHGPFWNFGHIFFTYVIPILPFVMVFDGYMSALRTRTPQEILDLIATLPEKDRAGWEWKWGRQGFAKPVGDINYFIGIKNPSGSGSTNTM